MKQLSRQKIKGRKETGTFLRVPTSVLESPNFCSLSNKAKALLLDIGARFNGFNNGDLAATYAMMKARGWKSKDTLSRALNELLDAGMIELTRQGGLHGPSLYAFTWLPIEYCNGKLDVAATRVASGNWRRPVTAGPAETRSLPQSLGKADPTIGLDRTKTVAV